MAMLRSKSKFLSPRAEALLYIGEALDPTKVRKKLINKEKGLGVIANTKISKNEFICEYRGSLIKHANIDNSSSCYIYEFKHDEKLMCIDATVDDGSLGRLVNDSRYFPNAVMKKMITYGYPHLCLFAARDIQEDEEITYFYGFNDLPWHDEEKLLYTRLKKEKEKGTEKIIDFQVMTSNKGQTETKETVMATNEQTTTNKGLELKLHDEHIEHGYLQLAKSTKSDSDIDIPKREKIIEETIDSFPEEPVHDRMTDEVVKNNLAASLAIIEGKVEEKIDSSPEEPVHDSMADEVVKNNMGASQPDITSEYNIHISDISSDSSTSQESSSDGALNSTIPVGVESDDSPGNKLCLTTREELKGKGTIKPLSFENIIKGKVEEKIDSSPEEPVHDSMADEVVENNVGASQPLPLLTGTPLKDSPSRLKKDLDEINRRKRSLNFPGGDYCISKKCCAKIKKDIRKSFEHIPTDEDLQNSTEDEDYLEELLNVSRMSLDEASLSNDSGVHGDFPEMEDTSDNNSLDDNDDCDNEDDINDPNYEDEHGTSSQTEDEVDSDEISISI